MAWNNEYPYIDPNRVNTDWQLKKVKEFEQTLKSWESTIEEIEEAIKEFNKFDGRITALEVKTDAQGFQIADLESGLQSVRAAIVTIQSELLDFGERLNYLEDSYDSIIRLVDIKLASLKSELEAALEFETRERILADYELGVRLERLAVSTAAALEDFREELSKKEVTELYNPIAGKKLSLDANNRKLYVDLRDHGITYGQMLERPKTYEELSQFTFKDLALKGGEIFKYIGGALSPITGKLELTRQSLSLLIGKVYGSYAYGDFESKTFAELASLGYTYRQMMSYNPNL
jgi:DNA-binding transcriptional ArsR family regulator